MRRSSREPKKPEFLTFSNLGQVVGSQESTKTAEDTESDLEASVASEVSSTDEAILFVEDAPKRKRSTSGRSRTTKRSSEKGEKIVSKAPTKPIATLAAPPRSRLDKSTSLIDRISSENKFELDAEEWIEHYHKERVSAVVELVNMALMAAGAKENCLESDIDLDALDHEEIEALLIEPVKKMTQTEGSKLYPLVSKGKGKQNFRKKYQSFWQTLCWCIYSASSRGMRGDQALHIIVEQLSTLSSMAVVNIRDAVLEASLSIADSLSKICIEIKGRRDVAERQLASATKTKRVADDKTNALAKQKDQANKELSAYSEVLQTIFASIFLHRSKDFQEELRLHTLRHLPAFLAFDVSLPLHLEHLKYLGWACFDSSVAVRAEAMQIIHDLVKREELVAHLQDFVDHFIERIICMAAGDEPAVALSTIQTLRVMQTQGLLDAVSEDQLDLVDAVVFDADAAEKVRAEALRFLMDHTQGFDDLDEDELRAELRKKSSKSCNDSAKKREASIVFEQQRNRALQLETLTEFAEHHLQDRSDGAALLAEALLATNKADLLFDWSTIVSLLTRENEELITSALRPAQVSILLRMFATSAHTASLNLSQRENEKDVEQRERGRDSAKERELRLWRDRLESLSVELQAQLPKLLVRFRDSDKDLAVLSELLATCSAESLSAALLPSLQQLLLSPQQHSDALTRNVAAALRRVATASASSALCHCVQTLWRQCVAHAQDIAMLLQRESERRRGSAARRRGSGAEELAVRREVEEAAMLLAHKLRKFQILWETVDCRPFLLQGEGDGSDDDEARRVSDVTSLSLDVLEIVRAAPALCSLSMSFSPAASLSASVCDSLSLLVRSVLGTARVVLLWVFRDALAAGRALAAAQGEGESAEHAQQDEDATADFEAKLELVREIRDAIVDTCLFCLRGERETETQTEGEGEGEGEENAFALDEELTRRVRVTAFVAVNDLRALFPQRLDREMHLAVPLALPPHAELLRALKSVFDEESARLRERLDALDRESEREEATATTSKGKRREREKERGGALAEKEKERAARDAERVRERDALSRELVQSLLLPLSAPLVFDVDSLNRKQMAAVLVYLFDDREQVQEATKSIARALRERDLFKFLQVQLLLLKDLYLESVLDVDRENESEDEDEQDGEGERERDKDMQRARQHGVERVQSAARKLSGLVGVGKLKPDAAQFVRDFLFAGVDHALQSAAHCDFLHALCMYQRFLTPALKEEVAQRVQAALAEKDAPLRDELRANDVLQHFLRTLSPALASALAGQHATSKPRRERKSSSKPPAKSALKKKRETAGKAKEKETEKDTSTARRRSTRSRARPSVSYTEKPSDDESIDEFSDEEFVREMESQRASQRANGGQDSRRPSQCSSFATGLDIDDLEEEDGEDGEEEEEEREVLTASKKRVSRASASSSSSSQKRPLEMQPPSAHTAKSTKSARRR